MQKNVQKNLIFILTFYKKGIKYTKKAKNIIKMWYHFNKIMI